MTEVSRWLAVLVPAAVLVLAVVALRQRWGHTLIRPALWLTASTLFFVVVYRTIVVVIDTPQPGSVWFEVVIFLNNFVIALLAAVVSVFLAATRAYRKRNLPFVITTSTSEPSKESVKWRRG